MPLSRAATKKRRWRVPIFVRIVIGVVVLLAVVWFAGSSAGFSWRGEHKDHSAGIAESSAESQDIDGYVKADHNSGLQQIIDNLAARGDYAIAITKPNSLQANANGDKPYTAASTYKLFVAYAVFQQINSGKMSWSDSIISGYNAEECFEAMIVRSFNDCVLAFGNQIGWQTMDDMMTKIGLNSTQLKWHDNITTANDLDLFLTKLLEGSLLKRADANRLLDAMKRQIYREGVVAGTGEVVANKPGFLDDLLHDAAIVYGQSGPYVMVIMSNGSSWGELADTAKQIHNFIQDETAT